MNVLVTGGTGALAVTWSHSCAAKDTVPASSLATPIRHVDAVEGDLASKTSSQGRSCARPSFTR